MMNVPVGKSTLASWAAAIAAAAGAVVEAIQNGWSWQVAVMAAISAALIALNGAGRAYQAAHPPEGVDAISVVGFTPDDVDTDPDVDTVGYKG